MTSKLKCPFCQTELIGNSQASYCNQCAIYGHNEIWNALIQAKQDLEQSEKCCSAWEIQALDYKAETIALSGKLEIATQALEKYADEDMWATCNVWEVDYIQGLFLEHGYKIAKEALEEINRKED